MSQKKLKMFKFILAFTDSYTPLHYACFNDTMTQERRPELAVLLLAYGANYNVKNKYGDNVLCSELRGRHADVSILSAIARCTRHLPSLESLGIVPVIVNAMNPPNVEQYPPPLHHPPLGRALHEHFQERGQQQLLLARPWSDNQHAKLAWYKDMLKGPRTLQHYCRCVIRERMGPKRLIMINRLPLPNTMKEFLLLQYG